MATTLKSVPYGNCKIRDKVGNTTIIISTDNIEGKTSADFEARYKRIQDIVYTAEYSRALRNKRRKALGTEAV